MTKYQGWENYQTWAAKLWMDNDQGLYNYFKELTTEYADKDVHEFADAIKGFFEENMPEVKGVWSDLLTHALQEVNWQEIAESLREE